LSQRSGTIIDVVTKALVQIPLDEVTPRVKCDVRVYGGWYEGNQITRLAQNVTVELQRDFPTVIRLLTTGNAHIFVSTSAELAVALLQEPGHHLFNTYRRKGKPANVRVMTPTDAGCINPDCVLPLMKKLLSKGNCPKAGCGVTMGNLVYRHEQKIVDTMLTCDLIYASNGIADRVILVSGDDDFLPPIRTILLRGTPVVRFHSSENFQQASFPRGGAQLTEKAL
jgi:uncharacterized LabA/DUF88 family protein